MKGQEVKETVISQKCELINFTKVTD